MRINIIVATHKKYNMPQDDVYLPVHVGAKGKESIGYTSDDTGENISEKNPYYCELTGLYWAWKNLECDVIGLSHYRRHFTLQAKHAIKAAGKTQEGKQACVLSGKEISQLMEIYDIIVPSKRKYYIETLYSHYSNTHYSEHLDMVRNIIETMSPQYLKAYDETMKQKSGYMFNMYIMKKALSDEYCNWLFPILFELEKKIGNPELSTFQNRLYGRVSELLFNVWLKQNQEEKNYRIKEVKLLHMEKVNWLKKGSSFILAKFFHKKYNGSF